MTLYIFEKCFDLCEDVLVYKFKFLLDTKLAMFLSLKEKLKIILSNLTFTRNYFTFLKKKLFEKICIKRLL